MKPLIRLGPAGVPISCEKRDTISGIKKVAELGLQALEVEFVRGAEMGAKIVVVHAGYYGGDREKAISYIIIGLVMICLSFLLIFILPQGDFDQTTVLSITDVILGISPTVLFWLGVIIFLYGVLLAMRKWWNGKSHRLLE